MEQAGAGHGTNGAPPRYAGAPGAYQPPTVPTVQSLAAPPPPRRGGSAWPLLVGLVVVIALVAGFVVLRARDDASTGDDVATKADAPAPAPSKYGKLYTATAAGTGFRWTAPPMVLQHGDQDRLIGTVFEGDPYPLQLYGDESSFDGVIAFPSSGATSATELGLDRLAPKDEIVDEGSIDLADRDGHLYTTKQSPRPGFEGSHSLIATAAVDGAFVMVIGSTIGGTEVDRAEFDRLVASVVYDPDQPTIYNEAQARGYDAFDEDRLMTVTDPGSGLSWRSPRPGIHGDGPMTAVKSTLGDHTVYEYADGHLLYRVRVWPASAHATAADLAKADGYFLTADTVDDTRDTTVAGKPAKWFHTHEKNPEWPQRKLFVAAEVDGAYITVEGVQPGTKEVNASEFDRLVASITKT